MPPVVVKDERLLLILVPIHNDFRVQFRIHCGQLFTIGVLEHYDFLFLSSEILLQASLHVLKVLVDIGKVVKARIGLVFLPILIVSIADEDENTLVRDEVLALLLDLL